MISIHYYEQVISIFLQVEVSKPTRLVTNYALWWCITHAKWSGEGNQIPYFRLVILYPFYIKLFILWSKHIYVNLYRLTPNWAQNHKTWLFLWDIYLAYGNDFLVLIPELLDLGVVQS